MNFFGRLWLWPKAYSNICAWFSLPWNMSMHCAMKRVSWPWRSKQNWKSFAFQPWTTPIELVLKFENLWLALFKKKTKKQGNKTLKVTPRDLNGLLILTCEIGWGSISMCCGNSHAYYCTQCSVLIFMFKNFCHQSGNLGPARYRSKANSEWYTPIRTNHKILNLYTLG